MTDFKDRQRSNNEDNKVITVVAEVHRVTPTYAIKVLIHDSGNVYHSHIQPYSASRSEKVIS